MAVYAITQARLGSERLPGKVLKKINGLPLLAYHLMRLNDIPALDRVVVATPEGEANSVLHHYLLNHDHDYVTGSENNVLARFHLASKALCSAADDIILRITADCPLLCPDLISEMLQAYQLSDYDYYRLDTDFIARGFDAELFRAGMLEEAHAQTESAYDKEHVTPYFYRSDSPYKIGVHRPDLPESAHYRLCVDEINDFELVAMIIQAFPETWRSLRYTDIIDFLNSHPEIAAINQQVIQRNQH